MIRVYDFSYNLLAETDRAISSEWELKFNGIGTFDGSFDINSPFTKVFAENSYLILTEDDRQAICVGSRIGDRLNVYGRTPEWLLSKRIVLPFKTSEIFGETYTDPETIILYLLEQAYKTPYQVSEDGTVSDSQLNTAAVCEDFMIPEAVGAQKLTRHFWRNSANPLSEVIQDLCTMMDCGYSLTFVPKEKCWKFSLDFGEERDTVISKSLKNAYDMSLRESILESAAGGYFEVYQSEETEQTPYGYVKRDGDDGAGMLYWETVLGSASGLSEAQKTIDNLAPDVKLECEVLGAQYGADYSLGDILRVQIEAGAFRRTVRQRVSGVSILNSSSGKSIKPSFSSI